MARIRSSSGAIDAAAAHEQHGRNADALLINFARQRHRARAHAAHIGMMRAIRDVETRACAMPFMNTPETAVMSGRCVPPRKGSFRIATSPGAKIERLRGVLHRKRHRAQMHGHVIAHGHRFAVGVVNGAGIIAALLDIGRKRSFAQHRAHLFGDGDQQMPEQLQLDGIGFFILCSSRYSPGNWRSFASDYSRIFRSHSCAWRRRFARASRMRRAALLWPAPGWSVQVSPPSCVSYTSCMPLSSVASINSGSVAARSRSGSSRSPRRVFLQKSACWRQVLPPSVVIRKKRIARRALQVGAGDPAVLEIDELNLIEPGRSGCADAARSRFFRRRRTRAGWSTSVAMGV